VTLALTIVPLPLLTVHVGEGPFRLSRNCDVVARSGRNGGSDGELTVTRYCQVAAATVLQYQAGPSKTRNRSAYRIAGRSRGAPGVSRASAPACRQYQYSKQRERRPRPGGRHSIPPRYLELLAVPEGHRKVSERFNQRVFIRHSSSCARDAHCQCDVTGQGECSRDQHAPMSMRRFL
jgi:hypothetical protein